MKSAAAYLRLSYKVVNGELIAEDRDGISRQRQDMKREAARLGAELPDDAIFFEDDTSASKKRDAESEWAKALSHIETEKPDLFLGAASDRLGRRLADIEGLEELTKETGTKVWTLKEQDLFASPHWPHIAAQAKVESINTAIRVRRAQEARRAAGKNSGGGNRPYGYKADRLTVVEKEAEVIRDIVRRVSRGEAVNSIAFDLNSRKVPTSTVGKQWEPLTVRRIAENPRYAGMNVYKGEVIGKGAWTPIISVREHEAAKRALETVSKPREGRPTTSLLGGIVRCGREGCGMTMNSTRSGRSHKIYRCSGNKGGKAGCGRTARGRHLVDEYVIERLMSELDESVIEEERKAAHAPMQENADQQADLMIQIAEIQRGYTDKRIGAEDYFTTLDMLRKQQQKLERQWGRLELAYQEMSTGLEARERWDSWTNDEKRAFIRSRIVAVVVHPSDVWGIATEPIQDGEIEILWRDNPLAAAVDSAAPDHTIPGVEGEHMFGVAWRPQGR